MLGKTRSRGVFAGTGSLAMMLVLISVPLTTAVALSSSSATSTTSSGPYVGYTLFLGNNTLWPGNVIPSGIKGGPTAIQASPNGYVYVDGPPYLQAISDTTNRVAVKITGPQGADIMDMAYDSSNGDLYLTNSASNSVVVVSTATNAVVANITLGPFSNVDGNVIPAPWGIVYDSSNGNLYVGSMESNGTSWLSVIDGATNEVVKAQIALPSVVTGYGYNISTPSALGYDPQNKCVYVPGEYFTLQGYPEYSLVTVMNTTTNTILTNVKVIPWPTLFAFDPENGFVYVSSGGTHYISVINGKTNTMIGNVSLGGLGSTFGLAFDPTNGYLYVTAYGFESNAVSVIDPATNELIATIPAGDTPEWITYDPSNGDMYVVNGFSNTISVIVTPSAMPWWVEFEYLATGVVIVAAPVAVYLLAVRRKVRKAQPPRIL